MKRRSFLKLTGVSAMTVVVAPSLITQKLYAANGDLYQTYEKIQLKDVDGNPFKATTLTKEENYVFNFPMVSTPCILVDLGEATQKEVKLRSDDGTDDSFFQYVPKAGKTMAYKEGGVFVCSSHLSAFTPKDGGKRVNGPATEGLTQIVLEIDEEDNIWAVGALGPSKFHDYLDAFKPEFKKYYGGKRKGKKLVKVEAKVVTLSNFSKDLIQY